jgi:DnaK suppressor protein
MDENTKNQLRTKLQAAEREFGARATRQAEAGRDAVPEGTLDPGDRAESTYEKEFLFSTSENSSELLQMARGALGRMEDGSYGRCLSCGTEIPVTRLEAVPWTHLCIACQERAEAESQGNENAA